MYVLKFLLRFVMSTGIEANASLIKSLLNNIRKTITNNRVHAFFN